MVTVEDVRRIALALPRTTEHLIHDRVKFRVGSLVYVAFSRDETEMGFAYPRDERDALIAAEPGKFFRPAPSDERYNWVRTWPAELDESELRELVVDAWRMVVPKRVAAAWETAVKLSDPTDRVRDHDGNHRGRGAAAGQEVRGEGQGG